MEENTLENFFILVPGHPSLGLALLDLEKSTYVKKCQKCALDNEPSEPPFTIKEITPNKGMKRTPNEELFSVNFQCKKSKHLKAKIIVKNMLDGKETISWNFPPTITDFEEIGSVKIRWRTQEFRRNTDLVSLGLEQLVPQQQKWIFDQTRALYVDVSDPFTTWYRKNELDEPNCSVVFCHSSFLVESPKEISDLKLAGVSGYDISLDVKLKQMQDDKKYIHSASIPLEVNREIGEKQIIGSGSVEFIDGQKKMLTGFKLWILPEMTKEISSQEYQRTQNLARLSTPESPIGSISQSIKEQLERLYQGESNQNNNNQATFVIGRSQSTGFLKVTINEDPFLVVCNEKGFFVVYKYSPPYSSLEDLVVDLITQKRQQRNCP